MPLLQIHVLKSTRMHHFEGQIAEAPIVGEGLAPLPHPPPARSASPPSPVHALFQLFFHFLILIPGNWLLGVTYGTKNTTLQKTNKMCLEYMC